MLTVAIFCCLWIGTLAFLCVTGRRNLRAGYRKRRDRAPVLVEEWAWLLEMNEALKQNSTGAASIRHTAEPGPGHHQEQAASLSG